MSDRRPATAAPSFVNWARQQVAANVLRRVSAAFGAAGVTILPVKGLITARLLYEDLAQRPISDIDLRIMRKDLTRAVRVADRHGWRPRASAPRLWEAVLTVDDFEVDIECSLGPPGFCAIPIADTIRRARTRLDPLGFPYLEPELHDHALFLVANAFKDGLQIMPWALEDLRRILRHPQLNQTTLILRARQGGILSALWVVADWLATSHSLQEWGRLRDQIGASPPSARVAYLYSYLQCRGWSAKPALLAVASSNDRPIASGLGMVLAMLGILRGRAVRAFGARPGRVTG